MKKFKRGDRVRKLRGSEWTGIVVGEYSTDMTPEGYCVESEHHIGSVQIYPAAALAHYVPAYTNVTYQEVLAPQIPSNEK